MAENKVNLLTEGFSVENAKKGTEGVKISGFALPFDTTSRNGFSYRKESIIKQHKSLEGKSMFLNHDLESLPLGRVESVSVDEKGMHYEATLLPTTEHEKAIVEKVKQGLLNKVSIQCIYENAKVNEKTGEFSVDVSEFLELSLVGVPGFEDTTLQAHEKLSKENKIKMAAKKIKEELDKKPEDETSSEQEDETQDEAPVSRAEYEELMSRVSVLESRMDANDEEESEESADEEDKSEESEEEDKKEESESDDEEKSEESDEDEEEKSEESIKRQTAAPKANAAKEYDAKSTRFNRLMSRN